MGLEALEKLIDDLERFDAHEELQVIVTNNKDVIKDLQQQQMAGGVDSEGNEVLLKDNASWNYGYRPYTIREKEKVGSGLGAVTDRVTGYMTGQLYQHLAVRVKGDEFDVSSDVPYFDELESRIGEQWMGLNEQSRIQFGEDVVIPDFSIALRDKTGLEL